MEEAACVCGEGVVSPENKVLNMYLSAWQQVESYTVTFASMMDFAVTYLSTKVYFSQLWGLYLPCSALQAQSVKVNSKI